MKEEPRQISPKNLKKISEKQFNMSIEWFIVFGVFIFLTVVLILLAVFVGNTSRIVIAALISLLWVLFLWKFRTDELLENTKLFYQFYIRRRTGATLVSKYNDAARKIVLQFLGIIKIDDGLIEYENNIYFCLIQYYPPCNYDSIKAEFFENVSSFLRTLRDGNQFQFTMTSVTTSSKSDSYESQIISASNREKITQPIRDHLLSVQKLINQKNKDVKPEFSIMCGLGNHKTESGAREHMDVVLEGLKNQFQSLGVQFRVLRDPVEITYGLYKSTTKGL